MNKKGFLLGEETLKIVMALICIGLLIYLLFAIYYGGFGDKDLKLAKTSLDYLIKELDAGVTEIEIYNPETWVIINLPQDETYICICKEANECERDKNCKKPQKQITIQSPIKILEPPITLELNNNILTKKEKVEE